MRPVQPVVRIERLADRVFEGLGMRPIGMLVFVASALAMWHLVSISNHSLALEAVAVAERMDHPSRAQSFVTRVHVRPGDRVEIGMPLVELSPYFIDQRLGRLDLQIEELMGEAELAQAKLRVREERWIEPALRTRPSAPSLEAPTLAYYAKQIDVERARRASLEANREALTVRSLRAGVVAEVLWVGAAVDEGTSVVSVVPEYADEVVAYMPPDTDPETFTRETIVFMREQLDEACSAPMRELRRGGAVEVAPVQLKQLFRFPVVGMPVHISIPEACRLGVGQVVSIEFNFEAAG